MDVKNSLVLKKKRELLVGINKRKMSLRKHIDMLKPNECRLDITQITKCVFLGSLCLKPVPQLFDSPLLLEELDMKVGNVRTDVIINNENNSFKTLNGENHITPKNSSKRGSRKRCLNPAKIRKKSLRERNDSKTINGVIKDETVVVTPTQCANDRETALVQRIETNDDIPPPKPLCEKVEKENNKVELAMLHSVIENDIEVPPTETSFQENNSIKSSNTELEIKEITITEPVANEHIYEFEEDVAFEESILNLKLDRNGKDPNSRNKPTSEDIPPDIKTITSVALHYEDVERLKREPTPELILSDSDEDAIDQLMFNIMDIKVGPNMFDKDLFDIPSPEAEEFEEYSSYCNNTNEDHPNKNDDDDGFKEDKKMIKRTPQCKICSQVFGSYIQLKKHKAAHNGDKPYLCLKCNENHTTLDQLVAHLRTHQGKHPYVCKKCSQGFKSMKALENHQPVHVLQKTVPQKKAFKCEVCGKEFRKLCDLERHTRVHTGEKPSVCNICNRRFQQAHNLNKHLLIHTKEKPFECDVCNKKFGRNDVLTRHMLTHSVKKPNYCNVCMKSFIRVSQLLAHKEKYHSNEAS
ncbi:hypothetical protein Zmor_005835 [Zophobas morio]|uniref:C2H2-type domain-containing protein n=1 Tax=Zophobas morio TaxID=2755281 RepID=A0AA38IQN6_9CUCU|nr:hypothetical protein Zmor_005835 [Zophobas morio]